MPTRVTGDGERFEHDLLNDQTRDEVALCDRAHECFANSLPVLRVDVVRNIHADLAAFSSERGSVSVFALCVFKGVGNFFRVVAYGRECGVVHGSHKFARDRLGKNVLPDWGCVEGKAQIADSEQFRETRDSIGPPWD